LSWTALPRFRTPSPGLISSAVMSLRTGAA
jgi:hypothetical protein